MKFDFTKAVPATQGQRAKEKDLVNALKKLFAVLKIPYYINIQGPMYGTVKGRPDMEAIYRGITYYIECKRFRRGKMSGYQKVQRERIEKAGAPYIKAEQVEDVVKAMKLPVLLT